MSYDDDWPSKGEIATWWENYFVEQRKNGGKEYLDKYPTGMWLDFGEPDCWACERYDPNFNDIHEYLRKNKISKSEYYSNPKRYILEMWENTDLERHHILPRSLSGDNHPSNFCLLCHHCHKEAPHTDDADYFWKWAKERRQNIINKYFEATKEALNLVGQKDNFELANLLLFARNTESHPHYQELQDVIFNHVSFHGEADWSIIFRDEMYHIIQYSISQNWTIDYLKQCEKKMIKNYEEIRK